MRVGRRGAALEAQLEGEGYAATRSFKFVIAGTETREEAVTLAERFHGEAEPGGELVWEVAPQNPFAASGRARRQRHPHLNPTGSGAAPCHHPLAIVVGKTARACDKSVTRNAAAGRHYIGYSPNAPCPAIQRSRPPSVQGGGTRAVPHACKKRPRIRQQSEAADGLVADALRAEGWAGEPFLHPDEDPALALGHGTARRLALDEALTEIEAGRRKPSPSWRVRFALMLGLERVLSDPAPPLASDTELRRHQIDALAGMLAELIAANERPPRGTASRWPKRRRPKRRKRTTTRSTSARPTTTRTTSRSSPPARTPEPSAATGSAIRPPPARRSPQPASSRPRERTAS